MFFVEKQIDFQEYLFLINRTGYKSCRWREATVSLIVFTFIDGRSLIISTTWYCSFITKDKYRYITDQTCSVLSSQSVR